jgi:UDP-N-acetylmuramyl pentapeptide phosphotransferase/UDP-N-acetylglucosamine-1-phosphate transferase
MLESLILNLTIVSTIILIGSFFLVYFMIPRIIWVVRNRGLIDIPNKRSTHKTSTPTMAGFAFFITFILVVFFIKNYDVESIGLNIIAALTVIFSIGIKDDLVISTPKAKLLGETIAILLLLQCNCMQINSLDGFLGIDNIPIELSNVLVILMLLIIINSYNLIDGIDGLAGSIGIVIFTIYAFLFFIANLHFYFLICLSLIGMLLAYLRYNFSSKNKIFMGDTGSLFIGFCIGLITLKFLSMNSGEFSYLEFRIENKIIVILSILHIPLFDTCRVIGIRLLNKKNILKPDRNHIHHVLIDAGLSHFKASILLVFLSSILGILCITLSLYLNSFQMLLILSVVFILFILGIYRFKRIVNRKLK